MNNNQKGFSAVEGLLIAVIAGLIGFIGWYVYSSQNQTNKVLESTGTGSVQPKKKTTSQKSTTVDPYAGWKEYCSKQEKSCFKYPADWATTVSQASDPAGDGITINSPNGSHLVWASVISGLGGGCGEQTDPHTYINKVIHSTLSPALYVVETGPKDNSNHIGLINGVRGDSGSPPTEGYDLGVCAWYTVFKSKHDSSMNSWLETNGSGGYKPSDQETLEKILLSYHS